MPDTVSSFVASDDIVRTRTSQEVIATQYRWGISEYVNDRAKVARCIFDLMTGEISQQDKRFAIRDVEGDPRFNRYDNDFMRPSDANVALPTCNVKEPRYPLAINLESAKLRQFSSDVGPLAYQCGTDATCGILGDRSDVDFGAICENAVAQELSAHGHRLFYFVARKVGELDFVIQARQGSVAPIEVKSGKGHKRHSIDPYP